VGLAVNAYVVRRALRLSDALFARIPVVKTVYVAIRDFMRFFPSSGQAAATSSASCSCHSARARSSGS
jgi:uncharacterized membrane protein